MDRGEGRGDRGRDEEIEEKTTKLAKTKAERSGCGKRTLIEQFKNTSAYTTAIDNTNINAKTRGSGT
jgi:hypothetical protein